MAQTLNTRRRLSKPDLQNDDVRLTGMRNLVGYTPANHDYDIAKIDASDAEMKAFQETERAAYAAYIAARDNATEAEHKRHTLLLGGGEQVAAQYGKNSNEYQSLGLKKKSEYKRPVRRKKPEA
ncbi:hypothetical protein [Armatimonas sp.]|uniref:hypothetical protein n=1 Tax=Armatimonas sp. TaxID=1872638 RepID=UPI00374D4B1B